MRITVLEVNIHRPTMYRQFNNPINSVNLRCSLQTSVLQFPQTQHRMTERIVNLNSESTLFASEFSCRICLFNNESNWITTSITKPFYSEKLFSRHRKLARAISRECDSFCWASLWQNPNPNKILLQKYFCLLSQNKRYSWVCIVFVTPLAISTFAQIAIYGPIQKPCWYDVFLTLTDAQMLALPVSQTLVDKIMTSVVSETTHFPKEFTGLLHYFITTYNRSTEAKRTEVCWTTAC